MFPAPAGSTTLTIPPRPRPYEVRFQTTNEWGTSTPGEPLTFATMTAGLTVDPLAAYKASVSARMLAGAQTCLSQPCSYYEDAGIVSWLQSRPDATQPWKTIGKYSALPPAFSTSFISYGGTEFRTYVPAWKMMIGDSPAIVTPAESTSARYSATYASFWWAGFNRSTASVGQVVEASVQVKPEIGGKASLQYWDGKVWRHSAYIPLTKGVGKLAFKATGKGTKKTYRISLPKLIWLGKPIVATNSPLFTLQVR